MSATRFALLSVLCLGIAVAQTLNAKYYYELHGDMELTEQKMRQMYIEYAQQF